MNNEPMLDVSCALEIPRWTLPAAPEAPGLTTRAVMDEDAFDVAGCLERVRAGDEEAARELVNYLYPMVIRIARRYRPRREPEEDLAQEIFVKMFAHLDAYTGDAPLVNWVSRIAVNLSLNRIRWQKSRPEFRMADLSEDEAGVVERIECGRSIDAAQQLASKDLVERLLGALDPKDAVVLRMLEMEGYSIDDISAETGWSRTLVRVRAFRARKKLNRLFKEILEKEQL